MRANRAREALRRAIKEALPREDLSLSQTELIERIRWLIALRWMAFFGVAATILVARAIFDAPLPCNNLLFAALAIPIYNSIFLIAWHEVNQAESEHVEIKSAWLVNGQILCDLIVLGALIHLSGGVENLFSFYFIFHMVIASILLSKRAAYAQAAIAVFIFAAVAVGEQTGLLKHYTSPIGIQVSGLHKSPAFVFASIYVLATALYVTVYLATSITTRLRWREEQVASLIRQSVRDAERLQAACEKLEEMEKAKSAYARKVAHELRSPLAAIDSLLLTISESLSSEASNSTRDMLQRARRRAHELLDIVHDLLVLASSRDVKHAEARCEVDLRNELEEVTRLLATEAEPRRIVLETEVDEGLPCVNGDPEGLREVLTNLIANAVKYSPDGSRVRTVIARAGQRVCIEVSDSGIGIPEEERARVFEEFYRGSNARSVTSEGTGLGLSIVRSVVEAHQGEIRVDSPEEGGTKFTVHLPISPGDESRTSRHAPRSHAA